MISDTNKEKIKAVVLTPEEIELAIIEGKTKKYFHEKHKPYWDEQERQNISTDYNDDNCIRFTT